MKIHGLQKMTLLDYPGHVACTVFLAGCDLRCPYCHNAELIDGSVPAVMDSEELLAFLKKRQGLLEGVAITGGEPLLRPDLPELAAQIRDLGYPVKLDTNGFHPARLRKMVEADLVQYVAMDLKNSPDRYAETIGMPQVDLGALQESIDLLMAGGTDYEFRTTVVAELHDAESFRKIAAWVPGARRFFLQKFTDRDSVPFAGLHAPSDEDLRAYADILRPRIPAVVLRGVD